MVVKNDDIYIIKRYVLFPSRAKDIFLLFISTSVTRISFLLRLNYCTFRLSLHQIACVKDSCLCNITFPQSEMTERGSNYAIVKLLAWTYLCIHVYHCKICITWAAGILTSNRRRNLQNGRLSAGEGCISLMPTLKTTERKSWRNCDGTFLQILLSKPSSVSFRR